MSESYGELIEQADRLRSNGDQSADALRAIILYGEALMIGGTADTECRQMIGVCYQILHEYDKAIEAYREAEQGASDYQRGNIERDKCESYRRLGQLYYAEASIVMSLHLLPVKDYPIEHAVSLGFLARLRLTEGNLSEALETFQVADALLHASGNLQLELYNKLHLANALSQTGHPLKARRIALESLRLSAQLVPATDTAPAHRVGSPVHQLRAGVLAVGGHYGDQVVAWVRDNQPLKRFRTHLPGRS